MEPKVINVRGKQRWVVVYRYTVHRYTFFFQIYLYRYLYYRCTGRL